MTLIPRSLAGRLRLASAIAIVAALLPAGVVIALILQHFIIGQIDQRLDAQIAAVSSALQRDANGSMSVTPILNAPPYDRPETGWAWQVSGPSGTVVSASLGAGGPVELPATNPGRLDTLLGLRDWFGLLRSIGRPKSAEGPRADGDVLHWRILDVPFGSDTVTIAAAAPYRSISGPLREALLPLGLALTALGLLLFGAMHAQVRLGLRPLAGLRAGLADVRAGKRGALPTDQASEVLPLVEEVNSLLAENAEGLARARRHVANLAHGLKTPLAGLGLALEQRPANAASTDIPAALIADMRAQLQVMERLIRHHLARARVAALAGPARASTHVGERLRDLVDMMVNIHWERGLGIDVAAASELAVAVEAQDFDEIIGNILDNACKWARSRVGVAAAAGNGHVIITIEDDGPGIDEAAMPEAMRPGQRMDEATPGHGFGLPIAAELVELYGGSLALSRTPGQGLRVEIRLPKAL